MPGRIREVCVVNPCSPVGGPHGVPGENGRAGEMEPGSENTVVAEVVGGADVTGELAGCQASSLGPRLEPQLGVGTGNAPGSKATQFKVQYPDRPPVRRRVPMAVKPSRLLRDMRHVYTHHEDYDRTYAHENCRRWLDQDPKGFMVKLAQLEAALVSGQAPASPVGKAGVCPACGRRAG